MVNKEAKKILIDNGWRLRDLAKTTGYSVQHVSNLLNGHLSTVRGKENIALALGKNIDELWPENRS